MLVNLLRRSNYLSQLRKCQTKCAIDREVRLDDSSVRQSVAQIDHRNASLNQGQNADRSVDLSPNRSADQNSTRNADRNRHNQNQEDPVSSNLEANQKPTGPDVGQPRRGKKKTKLKEDKTLNEDKKPIDPTVKRSIVRIVKHRKAMGLPDDLPFDEASKLVNEYFDGMRPGLKFFESTGSPVYGSNFNTSVWYRVNTKPAWYKHVAAELFEKNVIFDFSYDSFMNQNEKNSLAYQLMICLGLNRASKQPFPILFANLDQSSYVFRKLNEYYLARSRAPPMIKMTDKSYLDVLPRDQIVYLSPHAEESLTEFRPEYHYVLGCFIDISFSRPLSYKKAQAEGLKCYKLPIDEFVAYSKHRNRLLPLPIVHQILLDKKENVDWKQTLECNLGKNRLQLQMDELEAFERKYKNVQKHLYAL